MKLFLIIFTLLNSFTFAQTEGGDSGDSGDIPTATSPTTPTSTSSSTSTSTPSTSTPTSTVVRPTSTSRTSSSTTSTPPSTGTIPPTSPSTATNPVSTQPPTQPPTQPGAGAGSSSSKNSHNGTILIVVLVGVGAVVVAAIAIFVFRKLGTSPSDSFKNRLRQSFSPASHHSDTLPVSEPSKVPKYAVYDYEKSIPAIAAVGANQTPESTTVYTKYSENYRVDPHRHPAHGGGSPPQQYALYETHQEIPLQDFSQSSAQNTQQQQHYAYY